MRWFGNLPIKQKLLLIIMVSTSVALLLAGGITLGYGWVDFRNSLVRDLTTQTQMLAVNCASAVAFRDPRAASEYLEALRARPEILYGAVYAADHQVFARFERTVLPATFQPPQPQGRGYAFTREELTLTEEMRFENDLVGYVCLVASLKEYQQRLCLYLFVGTGVMLVGLLAALLVTTRLQQVFTGPLQALAQAANKVTQQHDYTVRVVPAHRDEIGSLTDGFNQMLEQIQRRDEELRTNEARLRLLVEQMPAMLWTTDRQLRLTSTVGAALKTAGLESKALLGRTLVQVATNLGEQPKTLQHHQRALAGESVVYETDWRGRSYQGYIEPLRDTVGNIIGAIGVALDVTEQQQARQAVRDAEERWRSLVENSPDTIIIADADGIIRYLNRATLGYATAEAIGQPVLKFTAGIDRNKAQRALQRLFDEGVPQFEEIAAISKTGDSFLFAARSVPIKRNGQVAGVLILASDITERRDLERQVLEISDREQARIGQDLHDGLCQHLVATAFACRTLERKLTEHQLVGLSEAASISALIDDAILQARQLSRGLYPVKLQAEGFAVTLEDLATSIRHLFNISCQVEFGRDPVVYDNATAIHLYRIVQEAVNNAIRHGKAGNIVISCHNDNGARATLRITDDGIGIAAERQRPRGLGLHIMNYRASMIGGTLDVKHAPEGGTVVTCSYEARRV